MSPFFPCGYRRKTKHFRRTKLPLILENYLSYSPVLYSYFIQKRLLDKERAQKQVPAPRPSKTTTTTTTKKQANKIQKIPGTPFCVSTRC